MFKRVPGTKDILPSQTGSWREIEALARKIFSLYNYKEIRPPLIEEAALFNRSLGESTEIVQKQMFLIRNNDDLYALRPEGTASIVRSYIENNLDKTNGFIKLYYIGPMFRLERPQRGRLRQFHHLGCEAIGSHDPCLDVEVINLSKELLESFRISGYTIKINSLGCKRDKQALGKSIGERLAEESRLCPECRQRLKNNPLRVLDCKNASCSAVIAQLNIGSGHLCEECAEHLAIVRSGLEELNIAYTFTPQLVRGLDYYSRTVFEITHPQLGSQDAIAAGGRYNNLVKELGGPDIGAIGFAFGVERVLLASAIAEQQTAQDGNLVFLITLGQEARRCGMKILDKLRKHGFSCDSDYEGKSLKGSLRAANDLKARYVLILGDDELRNGSITLKDMAGGVQKQVGIAGLEKELTC